jgi:DNA polymerase-1
MRRVSKAINFGILYGMGASSLAQSIGTSRDAAEAFIDRYFATYTGIARYVEEIKETARARGFVETMFGRRRFLPDILSHVPMFRAEAERQALNTPIQGAAADLIKIAMIKVRSAIQKYGDKARMVLQVHDELIFEVKEELVSELVPIVRKAMEEAYVLSVPLVVDLKVGQNWGEMEKI